VLLALLLAAAAAVAGGLLYVRMTGLSAQPAPAATEARLARAIRGFAVPGTFRARTNPVSPSDDVIERAMTHFAEHCAICHANDGSGATDIGRGLFPRPPDLRAPATQTLRDGELFYIIEHGVRFTGMPAFATGDADGEAASWELVHFIRRLPSLSADDLARMAAMAPRSPMEIRQEIEDELFLQGADAPPARPPRSAHEGAHP
jgi:mono/diheme cytochrome c family protein